MRRTVFIAFDSAQRELARGLKAALERRGVGAFIDEQPGEGDDWDRRIREAQEAADATVALVSREALAKAPDRESPHWRTEVARAVEWCRARGRRLLAYAVDGEGAEWERWPSGLSNFRQSLPPGASLDAETLATDIVVRLGASPELEGAGQVMVAWESAPPSPEAVAAIASWLEQEYRRPRQKKTLLDDAGLGGDERKPWEALIGALPARSLRRLVEKAGEADEVRELLAALDAPPGPVIEDAVEVALARGLEAAGARLRAGDESGALADYARIEGEADTYLGVREETRWRGLRERARLGRAISLNALGRFEECRDLLATVDPAPLDPSRRRTLGRFLASNGLEAEALRAVEGVDGAEVVAQLLAIRRGELPEALLDEPDVRGDASVLLLRRLRAGDAVRLAREVLSNPDLTEHGRALLAEVVARGLWGHWLGLDDRVADPLDALSDLDRALAAARDIPAWSTVREVRRWLDLDGVPDAPGPGALDAAAPVVVPEWVASFNELGERGFPIAELGALAERHPHIGPLQVMAARRHLQEEQPAGALPFAERATRILPGFGQRILLANAWFAAGRDGEARAILDAVGEDPRSEARSLRIQLALHHGGPGAVTLAESWTRAEPDNDAAWVWLALARMHAGDTAGAKAAAANVRPGRRELTVDAWRVVTAATLTDPVDERRALQLARAIKVALPGNAEGEALRRDLLLAAEGADQRGADAIDWGLLVEGGLAVPMSTADMREVLRQRQGVVEAWSRVWVAGGCVFERYAAGRGLDPGLWAEGIHRQEVVTVPPIPDVAQRPVLWRGARVLVGRLVLEVLAGLDLLAAFDSAVATVVVFSDTYEQLMNGAHGVTVPAAEAELDRTRRLWEPLTGLREIVPGSSAERIEGARVRAVRAWLAGKGAARRPDGWTEGEDVWQPGAATVVLGADVVYALGDDLVPLLRELLRSGVPVAVDAGFVRARRAREDELHLRMDAARRARAIYDFLGGLRLAGRLEVVGLPTAPELPPLADGTPDPIGHRAFAAREQLLLDPGLVLVSGEYAEMGLLGWGPPVLHARPWPPGMTLQGRYEPVRGRWTTVARVVHELGSATHRRALASAGYLDALDAADLLALHREFGTLRGEGARPVLTGVFAAMGGDLQPHHTLLVLHLALRLWPEAIGAAFLGGTPLGDAAEFAAGALDVLEGVERDTGGRGRLMPTAIQGLVLHSVGALARFAIPAEPGRVEITADSPGGTMWRAVVAWARVSPERLSWLELGFAQALRSRAAQNEGFRALAGVLYALLPLRTGHEWTNVAVLALHHHPHLQRVLRQVGDGRRSLSEALRELQAIPITRWAVEELDVRVDTTLVPFELLLDAGGADLARTMAIQAAPHDFALATALSRWADALGKDTREALAAAIERSPVRVVRRDPLVVAGWSRWADPAIPGPRGLADLVHLLGEPDVNDWRPEARTRHDLAEAVAARFTAGAWARFGTDAWLTQLARIPGGFVGTGAEGRAAAVEDLTLLRVADEVERTANLDSGTLAGAVLLLAMAAGKTPERRIGDRTLLLPTLAGQLAAAGLAERTSVDGAVRAPELAARFPTFADCEGPLVRLCGVVVGNLAASLALDAGVWLSWRLYAWLCDQLRGSDNPLHHARRLAAAAPPPAPPSEARGDLFDPARGGRAAWREVAVLQALANVLPGRGAARGSATLDWRLVLPHLVRIASRPLTEDEAQVRERGGEPSLGGPALVAPDLARFVLLRADPGHIDLVDPAVRQRWLMDAVVPRPASDLKMVHDVTLLAFTGRAAGPDRDALVAAVLDPDFLPDTVARRALVIAGWGVSPTLAGRARAACWDGLGNDRDRVLVGDWLRVHAQHGTLPEGVADLRAELASRGLDERAYLQTLSGLLFHEARAVRKAGRAAIKALLAEPALSGPDGLGEVARYVGEEDIE